MSILDKDEELPRLTRAEYEALKKAKKNKIIMIGGGVFFFLMIITWYGLQPITGPIQVGICRTFLELWVPYPQSLRFVDTDEIGRVWRVYFTYEGSFGEERSSMAECKFINDGPKITLESVMIDRVLVDQDIVEKFNPTIPDVISSKPSQIIPPPLQDNLRDLRNDDD